MKTKSKKAHLTKTLPLSAAELKSQMEANQIGAPAFDDEELIPQCIEIIRSEQKASVSLLQRRLRLGYTRACRIIDELERRNVVGPSKGAEPRDILIELPTGAQFSENDPVRIVAGNVTITAPSGETVTTSAKKLRKLAAQVKDAAAQDAKPSRRLLKPKSEQGDMVTEGKLQVPEPTSPLYIAGKRLKEAIVQEKLNDDEKAEAMQEVMAAMRRAKRYVYKVEGYGFELQHFGAQDKVKVIKPK